MLKKYSKAFQLIIIILITIFIIFKINRNIKNPSDNVNQKSIIKRIPSMEELDKENKRRIIRIRDVCKKYHLNIDEKYSSNEILLKYPPAPQYSVFYIDRIHKISYCPLYKCGSTTWLHNMCLLMNISQSQLDSTKKQISVIARRIIPEIDFPEAEQAILDTTKFLVVRHPFERLLSAYRDKLENSIAGREHGTLHFYHKYGAAIVHKYRNKNFIPPPRDQFIEKKNVAKPSGNEPTWKEFVDYLIDTDLNNYADDHWIPYYLYCTPCSINYTIVAKVETFFEDQLFAIEKMGLKNMIKPKWKHKTDSEINDVSRIYFRQLTKENIEKLYNKYQLDFEMFNYSPDVYYSYVLNYN